MPDNVVGRSEDPNAAGVLGEGGVGVYGRDTSGQGNGVIGFSHAGRAVWGHSDDNGSGVLGESVAGIGVTGNSTSEAGVLGQGATGVYGRDTSGKGNGVIGSSQTGRAVWGHSDSGVGVTGNSTSAAAVLGHSVAGVGVQGESKQFEGVRGVTNHKDHGGVVGVNTQGGIGVFGTSDNGAGVWGTSVNSEGIHAETHSTTTAAMSAYQMNAVSDSAAFYARHTGNRTAALFDGSVVVTRDLSVANAVIQGTLTVPNADCAEDFDIAADAAVEPGTVMVLDDAGALRESRQPYDKRVAGVISGAGEYRPGVVLDKRPTEGQRLPVALLGKVYCKVDASYGAVAVGDLLTTSSTSGHAMRAADTAQSFGSVIGKALRPLPSGQGLIPILIALQ